MAASAEPPDRAADAATALALFAVAPWPLGGARIRSRVGPALSALRAHLSAIWPFGAALRTLPQAVSDDRLLGGLELAQSLASGRPVFERGLLAAADGGAIVAPMAERLSAETAARLGAALDHGAVRVERDGFSREEAARVGLVLIDEGADAEERAPAALVDRLAFDVSLEGLRGADVAAATARFDPSRIEAARALWPAVRTSPEALRALVAAAAALGIASLRAPLLALAAARASAALNGRLAPEDADFDAAARLVLAPRATAPPEPEASDDPPPPEPPPPEPGADAPASEPPAPSDAPLQDLLLAAAAAALPPDILAAAAQDARARTPASREGVSGARRRGAEHGRPLPPRPAPARPGARLDLVATLRAAAPWTALRRRDRAAAGAPPRRVEIRSSDLRYRDRESRSESLTLFVVDASGSAAAQRLAEAKGAVELLLAESYSRRDHVALISFRGLGAELLLPPTRALARAKRRLAGLPGGGPTPLAAGVDMALLEALRARRDGRRPSLIFLTDGQANVRRDGGGGRTEASAEAREAATRIRIAGLTAVVLDVSPRPRPAARELAEAMGARYAPLPRADAVRLRRAAEGDAAAGAPPGPPR